MFSRIQQRETMETLGRRTFDMLRYGVMTDATFVVQGTEIKGHRDIVSSHGGPLRDRLKTKPEKMEINDISPRTFRTLLEYIYTDNCTVDHSNVFELMHAARKFSNTNLAHHCAYWIKREFSAANIAAHTAQALNFDVKEYLLVCHEYFSDNTNKVIEKQAFLQISGEVLSELCSSEKINCTELELFSVCVKWAKHQCSQQNQEDTPENLRTMLGDALSKMRFPCIPMEEFQAHVIPTGILSFEEIGEIAVGHQKRTQQSRYSNVDRTPVIPVPQNQPWQTKLSMQSRLSAQQPMATVTSSHAAVTKVIDSLGTRMFDMLNNNIMTDVTFIVEGTEIKAHRSVMGSSGGLLKDLLETDMGGMGRIQLQNIATHTFRTVLEYLYTNRCIINPANAFELVHAARNLHLKNLEIFCADEIKAKLSAQNVGEFAKQALHFDLNEYFILCLEYFQQNTLQVIATPEFLEISGEVLSALCGSERINCSEVELYSACIKWANHQCRQQNVKAMPETLRTVLGDALSKIRFPCIIMADFQRIVIPSDVLTFEEVGEVMAGWHMPNIKSRYSNVDRQYVQVTIEGYKAATVKADPAFRNQANMMGFYTRMEPNYRYVDYDESSFHVLLSTKISQLKSMKIFNGGKQECPSDKFTLMHWKKELADDVTLASIYYPGRQLTLQFGSFTFTVINERTQQMYPLTVNINQLQNKNNVMRESICRLTGRNLSITDFPNVYPGAFITVN